MFRQQSEKLQLFESNFGFVGCFQLKRANMVDGTSIPLEIEPE